MKNKKSIILWLSIFFIFYFPVAQAAFGIKALENIELSPTDEHRAQSGGKNEFFHAMAPIPANETTSKTPPDSSLSEDSGTSWQNEKTQASSGKQSESAAQKLENSKQSELAEQNLEKRYIITYNDQRLLEEIKALGGKIELTFETIQAVAVLLPEEDAKQLQNHPFVEAMEEDLPVSISLSPQPSIPLQEACNKKNALNCSDGYMLPAFPSSPVVKESGQSNGQTASWGIEKIGAPRAWQEKYTGKGVKIAILDTGIDLSHPDLQFVKGISFVPNARTIQDEQGHGTHVAGIIAAKNNDIGTVGVAPDAELYIVKVLNRYGEGFQSSLIKGIEWAMQQDVDIINLSLGGTFYVSALEEVINAAYRKGIIIVAAAGNRGNAAGNTNTVEYPAKFANVIAVAATDQSDKRAEFSATGPEVELSAPGVDIYSTYINSSYIRASGTSMATPFVTGHLALLKEAFPEFNHLQLRRLIRSQVVDLGPPGQDYHFGFGRILLPDKLSESTKNGIPSPFTDMDGTEWYAKAILKLAEKKLMLGYEDNTVRPKEKLTRAEATVLLVRMLQLQPATYKNSFRDVNEEYFAAKEIQAAFENNIIKGYEDGTFRPGDYITRGEVAELLKRSFKLTNVQINSYFPDVPKDYFASNAINALVENGLTTGFPDGTFKPKNHITRAEFAAFLTRILEKN